MDWGKSLKNSLLFIMRFLLITLLIATAFAVGSMFGYTILGNGGNPLDVFKPELWEHIMSFIFN